ncbi:glycosyltransferase family 2 protein [Paeniglutamicibacter sp. R2-26]|uniref:glycosyltransferase family 2 protein n=1 Tax=Paeniglutamicibacter sp. R2-26 TaxID=3144417 RepID=UPI003EE70868
MSPPTPRISVIIPAMDQQEYICDALESLARQELGHRELEVLVIDDASTDATPELAREFADRLPGLRVIEHGRNRGVSAARNTGLAHATGEFIVFLDPDDWMSSTHLATLAEGLERLEVDFVRCDHVRVTGGNRVLHRAPQALRNTALDPRDAISPVDMDTMIDYAFVWAGMYRASALAQAAPAFDEDLRTCEDRHWLWQLALRTSSYAVLNAPGVFYRRGLPGSLTQVFDERQLDFLPAYAGIIGLVLGDEGHAPHRAKALRQFLAIACHHLKRSVDGTPELRAQLREGIGQQLAALPPALLEVSLEQLDPARREMLAGLHPDAGTRKVAA